MIKILLGTIFFPLLLFGIEDEAWLEKAKSNVDGSVVEWLRENLQGKSQKEKNMQVAPHIGKRCYVGNSKEVEPALLAFISFSLPDNILISISRSLKEYNGVMILQGLPQNSFKELSKRLISLKENGLLAQVQIDPRLFDRYEVSQVPTYVVPEDNTFDKIAGNISVEYALEAMAKNGETKKAKRLLQKDMP